MVEAVATDRVRVFGGFGGVITNLIDKGLIISVLFYKILLIMRTFFTRFYILKPVVRCQCV